MMKSLHKAAQANREGSDLLELGETSKALRCFRSALKQLNDGCQCAAGRSLSSHATESITAVSSRPVPLGENHEATAVTTNNDATPATTPSPFYSQSFVFVVPSEQGDDYNSVSVSLGQHSFFSAVLIYNTALALHQKGSHGQVRQTLLKALLFYNESLNLLMGPIADQPEAFRVLQEILRNQADIYYRLNDWGNVQRVWEDLAALTKGHPASGMKLQRNSHSAASA